MKTISFNIKQLLGPLMNLEGNLHFIKDLSES